MKITSVTHSYASSFWEGTEKDKKAIISLPPYSFSGTLSLPFSLFLFSPRLMTNGGRGAELQVLQVLMVCMCVYEDGGGGGGWGQRDHASFQLMLWWGSSTDSF